MNYNFWVLGNYAKNGANQGGNSLFPILMDGILNTFILLWSGQLLLCFPEVALIKTESLVLITGIY
ncbi:hypothetical protein DHC50_13695 [Arenibacter sp. A80]|nr:hypothetical protein [Arenibacter sp. A80]RFT55730.1 hypothetical protein D0S24_13690 [Arenibacter sp. P308M17]